MWVETLCPTSLCTFTGGLLSSRLFDPDAEKEVVEDMQQTAVRAMGVFADQLDSIEKMSTIALQSFVRTQFLSVPKTKWSPAYADLMASLIDPALEIHVPSWNAQVVRGAKALASKIKSGQLCTVDELNLKMACKIAAGSLNEHPLIQGILVSSLEMARREQHGVRTMKRLRLSELELSLMSEAGCMISLAAGNMHLLRQFGLSFTVPRLPLSNLHGRGLPEPFLAMTNPCVLQTNGRIIESILVVAPAPKPRQAWIAEKQGSEMLFHHLLYFKCSC